MTLRGLFEFAPGHACAACGSRAGTRNRQAVLHRRHVARLDQQGSPRDAGHRHEPAGGELEHGRRRRGPAALQAACQRRFAQLRHQAGGQRAVRRDDRVPGQRQDHSDQDGPGGQAGRGRAVAGPQGDRGDCPTAALHARRVADFAAAPSRYLFDRRPGPVDLRPEVCQSGRDGLGQVGFRGGRGHGGGGRGQRQRRRGADQRPRRRHRRQPA